MKRPIESDYTSHVAYARALEEYCDMLEQPSQEPVAWMRPSEEGYDSAFRDHSTVMACTGNPWTGWIPLYTTPPAAQPAQQEPVETWEDLHNALQRIDTAAVGLPTFEVRHEGGLDAVVQNIVDAIVALHEDRTTPPAAQPAQEPHNFCPRCSKRLQGVLGRPQMHTCTPPLWGHT